LEKSISPCISLCRLNDEDICIGCFRTAEEISSWAYLDNDKKIEIINRCAERETKQNAD
jgi:predicted Fe-S protein YdhL (DUF1289 family)